MNSLYDSRKDQAEKLLDEVRKLAEMAFDLQVHPLYGASNVVANRANRVRDLAKSIRAIDNGFPTLCGDDISVTQFFQTGVGGYLEKSRENFAQQLVAEIQKLREGIDHLETLVQE